MPHRTRSDRASATRQKLIAVGRECFMEAGFAGTSIAVLLQRSQLARGGFYHHFRGKADLFAAVVTEVEAEVVLWMTGATHAKGGPWGQLRAACGLYLSSFTDAGVRRVLLVDGPAVLGEARAQEARLAALRARVEHALGDHSEARANSLALLLLGALEAAAVHLAGHEGEKLVWYEIHTSVMQLLEGLRRSEVEGQPTSPRLGLLWEEDPWEAWKRRDEPSPKS